MKYCHACEQDHPLTAFGKDKSNKDGFDSQCKACRKLYYTKNKERISQQGKAYYKKI